MSHWKWAYFWDVFLTLILCWGQNVPMFTLKQVSFEHNELNL